MGSAEAGNALSTSSTAMIRLKNLFMRFPHYKKAPAKADATELLAIPILPSLTAATVPWGLDHGRHSGSCFQAGFASAYAPPSQFPSDRIAPKGHRLNTYSNGVCSGLGPDFLITAPAQKEAARVGDAMQLMLFHRPKNWAYLG
jgi:hypothetical protein